VECWWSDETTTASESSYCGSLNTVSCARCSVNLAA
jgi:hypothetical protein